MNQVNAFCLREAAMEKWASIPEPMRLRIAYSDMLASTTYNSLGLGIAKVLQRAGVIVPTLPNGRIDRKHPDIRNFGNQIFNTVVKISQRTDIAEEIIQNKLTEFLGTKFHHLQSNLDGKDFADAKAYVLVAMKNAAYTYLKNEGVKVRKEVSLDTVKNDEGHPDERLMLQVVEKVLDDTQEKGIKQKDWWKHPAWRSVVDNIYKDLIRRDREEENKTKSGITISYLKLFELVFENGMTTSQAAKELIRLNEDIEVKDWRTVRNRARKVRDKVQNIIDVVIKSLQREGQLEEFFDLVSD